MSKAIIGNIGHPLSYGDLTLNGLYIKFLSDIVDSNFLLASTGVYLLDNSELISNYIYLINCYLGIYTNNSKITTKPTKSLSYIGLIMKVKQCARGIKAINSVLYFDKIDINYTASDPQNNIDICLDLSNNTQLNVYNNSTTLVGGGNTGATGTYAAVFMETGSNFEGIGTLTITNAVNGIILNNSQINRQAITVSNISNTGIYVLNDGVINNDNLTGVKTITITNAAYGIKLDNSQINRLQMTLLNITNTGLEILNNSIINNNVLFNSSQGLYTIIITNAANGIKLNNSQINRLKISLTNITTTGLDIINNSIINNSIDTDLGEYSISINGAANGLILNNSKINRLNMSFKFITNIGVDILNNSIINNEGIRINEEANTGICNIGMQINNNSTVSTTTIKVHYSSIKGITIDNNSTLSTQIITVHYTKNTGILISNKSYLYNSERIFIDKFGSDLGTTGTTGATGTNNEYGFIIKSESNVIVQGFIEIIGLNTSATSSQYNNGIYIDNAELYVSRNISLLKNVYVGATGTPDVYNSLGTGFTVTNNAKVIASKCVIENWYYGLIVTNNSIVTINYIEGFTDLISSSISTYVTNDEPVVIIDNSKFYYIGSSINTTKAGIYTFLSREIFLESRYI